MSQINLLPWREELRARQKKQFFGVLGVSALAGAVIAGLVFFHYSAQVSGQQDRNAYLEKKIEEAEKRVEEIQDLDAEKARLISRKEVIDTLQADRSRIVRLFESLVKATPDGVVLTLVKQNEQGMLLEGRAQSNTRVSDYMRNLEASGWMQNPNLTVIEATQVAAGFEGFPYEFKLSVGLAKLEEIAAVSGEAVEAEEQMQAPGVEALEVSGADAGDRPVPVQEVEEESAGVAPEQASSVPEPAPARVPATVGENNRDEQPSQEAPPPEQNTTITPPASGSQP